MLESTNLLDMHSNSLFCEQEFKSCSFNDKRLVRRFIEVTKNF